ncbi:MAG: isocitrate/isopropylmalate family dehydrogenase [Polyangiaceae bacterium]|nr:isocitrate/isopropylmalate family dehydrogenase [Polyangiaceae bacterium]
MSATSKSIDLLLLPGDGIGPEIMRAVEASLKALERRLDLGLRLETVEIGLAALERHGRTMPTDMLDRARRADGIVLGPLSTWNYPPADKGGVNVSALLRRELDLYANIRPCRTRPGLPSVARAMDLVIVRENSEGFLADRVMAVGQGEFMPTPDVALAVRKITASASTRIAEVAAALAAGRRRKLTAVHKGNSLKLSDGLFLRQVRAVVERWPGVEYEEVLVDAMAALLVRCPHRFDVVVTTNLFGDILSDEAAELSGSLGLAASLNSSERWAVAQAAHGSATDIAGQDRANPTGLLLSTAMLLRWIADRRGDERLARGSDLLSASVEEVLAEPSLRTSDLGGECGTERFGAEVAERIHGSQESP